MKKALLGFVLGVTMALAYSTLAAPKTYTYAAPVDYTSGGWSVIISGNAGAGGTSTVWTATTTACGWDAANGVPGDCQATVETTGTPTAAIYSFVNQRLTNWRAANGY